MQLTYWSTYWLTALKSNVDKDKVILINILYLDKTLSMKDLSRVEFVDAQLMIIPTGKMLIYQMYEVDPVEIIFLKYAVGPMATPVI